METQQHKKSREEKLQEYLATKQKRNSATDIRAASIRGSARGGVKQTGVEGRAVRRARVGESQEEKRKEQVKEKRKSDSQQGTQMEKLKVWKEQKQAATGAKRTSTELTAATTASFSFGCSALAQVTQQAVEAT